MWSFNAGRPCKVNRQELNLFFQGVGNDGRNISLRRLFDFVENGLGGTGRISEVL